MGNKQSCCVLPSSNRNNVRAKKKSSEAKYHYEPQEMVGATLSTESPGSVASCSNLQHISEREPEDADGDPSIHPTTGTIFLTRSKSEIQRNNKIRRRSHYDRSHSCHYENDGLSKKYSSCSTIFMDDSTISQPNLKSCMKAVALAIYFHIRNRDHRDPSQLEGRLLDIFSEKLHPLTKDPAVDVDMHDPEHKIIYRFIRMLFNAAQLTAECAIVTLVYLERLLTYADIEIVPVNWKRIVLGAILLASKVWDDQAVWTVDYCQIMKDITVEDMNELERQFLEMLQFNINVPASVYAKYYFDLRALAGDHNLSFPLQPLNKDRAGKLEAMSNQCESKLRQSHSLQRSHSLDSVKPLFHSSKAILS